MRRIKHFIKTEIVLFLSILLAVVSAFFVKPGREYLAYIDFRTLALLFCLMLVMAGLNQLGIFRAMAESFIKKMKTFRGLSLVLCLLCFFSSMLITNDVALITFVPFTIITLKLVEKTDRMIWLVVLETIAANLGSMLTPLGNPQNLYLFSAFQMSAGDFVSAVLPYALLSLVLIVLVVIFQKNKAVLAPADEACAQVGSYKTAAMYVLLFVLSLLTVFRVVPYPVTLTVSLVMVLLFDRRTLLKVDYSLLFTFVFLFIFIGNLGRIESISDFLRKVVTGNEVPAAVLASQVFSNVPAALLLSGFTDNAKALLVGVNLGGLGTLIASMASLISYKFIVKEGVKSGKYLLVFTAYSLVFLIANLILWGILQ